MQKVIQNGVETLAPVTQQIPVYQTIFPGGDTQLLGNFEYRIPIVGPVVLAAFFDGGVNKVFLPGQLRVNETRVNELNTAFPQAAFDGKAVIAKGTEKIRTSTGLELQIMMPVVNAPFRFYWAYNPTIVQEFLSRPIVTDRSYFPNQATFARAVALYGTPSPFYEKRSTFRFTISRTF
jgi:outer membrane protein insertion porin family